MKLLITGASGFIGAYVIRETRRRGHEVVAMVRSPVSGEFFTDTAEEILTWDLADLEIPPLAGKGIDGVVHLAAALSGDAEAQQRITVGGTERLLQAMRQAGISRLVGLGSLAVLDYEALPPMSLIDESVGRCPDLSRMGLYASLKARQEDLMARFARDPGHRCVILRPGLVYDRQRLISGHAGVVKGSLRLLAAHPGQVPTVAVEGVTRAILDAAEGNLNSGEVIHLVDDALPDQTRYLAALRRRGLLPAGGPAIPWQGLQGMARSAYSVTKVLGLGGKLPEALLPQACASRLKPFRYSNAKAKRLLNWRPGTQFS